jgi:queuosine precursor transporter
MPHTGPSRRNLVKTGIIMNRTHLPGILAMAAIVVASNILVQFLFGQWLTWGAFTYPLAFLVTDVMNRVYGVAPRAAWSLRVLPWALSAR